jgi:para-nitrobenzyl esterase
MKDMSDSPIVQTARGAVRGEAIATADGAPVVRYLGIPYAAAPTGDLRWKPPQEPAAWTGVRDGTRFGPDLPQAPNPTLRGAGQDEDCLHVNVWAPAQGSSQRLPVMVWIHGGGFVGGSGSDPRADGARMAAQGVVVVSFNYRTGLFGFLAHPALSAATAQHVSGNYGLLDQVAALRWVAANIEAFGGDPQRVTVFGVSAGSASISLLLTSPQATGLFQQVALYSAGAGRPLATLADAESAGRALGDDIAVLRALPSRALLQKTALLNPAVRGLTTPRVLRPICDCWLLPRQELDAYAGGHILAVPAIVGSNFDEGSKLTSSWPVQTQEEYVDLVRRNFGAAKDDVLRLYPVDSDAQVRLRVGELFADTQFNFGTQLIARSLVAKGQRAWRYLFTRRPPGAADGPHHAEEVAYVFGTLDSDAAREDQDLSAAMQRAWVAFARDGEPGSVSGASWQPYDARRDDYLEFGDEVRAGQGWRAEQLAFLDRFLAGRTV